MLQHIGSTLLLTKIPQKGHLKKGGQQFCENTKKKNLKLNAQIIQELSLIFIEVFKLCQEG